MELDPEKQDPFASLDGRKQSAVMEETLVSVTSLKDGDEALSFLENHPHPAQIAEEGNAILTDPKRLKRLVRKIDLTIAPLLAAVYFLQFLDKTTLSYTAVMGLRTDTHLKGQQYSDLGMLFYIGKRSKLSVACRCSDIQMLTYRRALGRRIPNAVPCTEAIAFRTLPRYQYHGVGAYSWLPCRLYVLRWPCCRANTARCIRKLVRFG